MAYIVFDFDGTLADMKGLILEIGNEIAAKHNWPPVNEALYKKLSRGSIRDGIKHLGIPLREIPFALLEGKRKLSARTNDIELFADIPALIIELKKEGHEIFVLSANSQKIIQTVLLNHNLLQHLTVLPSSSIFGKASALKSFIRKRRLDKADVWMVGDELRDIEAAKKAGVKSIAVTWGLQHPDTLRAAAPTYVADKPSDISKQIKL